ncbi:hypothetical protein ACV22V_31390 [Burkholderia sp. AW33-5]
MTDKQLFLQVVVPAIVALAIFAVLYSRAADRLAARKQLAKLADATAWELRLNDVAVATIPEHVVVDIERRLERQWWRGALTALSEFSELVRLASVSVAAGVVGVVILAVLTIQSDPLGAGHALHELFAASDTALQAVWSAFWLVSATMAFLYFCFAIWCGARRGPHDYVAEAWWNHVRRAAHVAPNGKLSLVLTEANRLSWRSPYRVDRSGIDWLAD